MFLPGFVMSRREDRGRSRTRRRRDRSPSSQPRKARRRDHDDTQDGMDWNNLVSWQHNSGYNTSSAFPMPQGHFQHTPSSSQQFQHPRVNYMMTFPPEPLPAKIEKPMIPPPVPSSQTTASHGHSATLPVQPQKAWLTTR